MRFVVTDPARDDLKEIGRYGRRTWGAEQSRAYLRLIIKVFAQVMIHPGRGRRQEHLSADLRRLNVREHAVFYATRGEDVVIARVLHQRADIRPEMFEGGD